MSAPVAERFWPKVAVAGPDECWPWLGYCQPKGYGMFSVGHVPKLAHRIAYELVIGPIPDGLELDHLCRNRSCVNPAHLEPVTHQVNTLRGDTFARREAGQTQCKEGHPFDLLNTRITSQGKRRCAICAREYNRRYRAEAVA